MHKTTLNYEWEGDWTETSFEKDIDKLQKEAEVRLDEKISELTANIANTGEPDN
jgi:mRNA-degrading endonuclease RelE of RelBE toxin-antitoxin system